MPLAYRVFSSPGTHRWVAPVNVERVTAYVWGAGSGGSNATLNGLLPTPGFGGAGGNIAVSVVRVTPGVSYQVVVGRGGRGGAWPPSSVQRTTGGLSRFTGDNASTVLAVGGTVTVENGKTLPGENADCIGQSIYRGGFGSAVSHFPNGGGGSAFFGGAGADGGVGRWELTLTGADPDYTNAKRFYSGIGGAGVANLRSSTHCGAGGNSSQRLGPTASQVLAATRGTRPGGGGGGGVGGFDADISSVIREEIRTIYSPGAAGADGMVMLVFETDIRVVDVDFVNSETYFIAQRYPTASQVGYLLVGGGGGGGGRIEE